MNTTYTLKTPFKSRRQGDDVTITELQIPEVITVRQFLRSGDMTNKLLWVHNLTEVVAGLNPIDGSKLMTHDAMGFVVACADLLKPRDEPGFNLPSICSNKTMASEVTAAPSNAALFAAQVLVAAGMNAAELDAMDVREFMPAVRPVIDAMSLGLGNDKHHSADKS